ncbi:TPA: hypothetical protein R6E38_001902 [Campylobacter jejuni]|nr:hypothetical protein [Campylobacter jejuni]HED8499287.1 hypothetical protein [Campylobacter jejuni]
MVNFDTQYTNINYLNNNTSNKKAVLKNDDDAYYESIIKNVGGKIKCNHRKIK